MRKLGVLALATASAIGLTGCISVSEIQSGSPSSGPPRSSTCTGHIAWNSGSLPPPHQWSWKIDIDENSASFTMWALSSDEVYSADNFDVEANLIEQLCEAATELENVEMRKDGGQPMSWNLDGIGEGATDDYRNYGEVESLVEQIVGAERWDEAIEARDEAQSKFRY